MKSPKELSKLGITELSLMMINSRSIRKLAIPVIDNKIRKLGANDDGMTLPAEKYARYCFVHNLLTTFGKRMDEKLLAKSYREKIVKNLVGNILLNGEDTRDQVFEKEGREIPAFITISPTQKCNLKCKGCYAASHKGSFARLDWETFDRILTEQVELWNSYFTVISGGEPFLWNDGEKNLFDILKKHSEQFFLIYTNGTTITKQNAKRLAELGNATPAISLEGFQKETDERRGKGVFDKILESMANLRDYGVPFGISVTATQKNAELVVSDEFIDFYFEKQKAVYGWLFQYMPIGRGIDLEYLVTPEQRFYMYQRGKVINEELGYDYVDFWNNGYMSYGCIAGGRKGGYLYIEWNGNVTPCVFIPYSPVNICDVYKNGGNLDKVLESQYFQDIKDWQKSYGYLQDRKEIKNRITPCFIRDHHKEFCEITRKYSVKPIDKPAEEALHSERYHKQMIEYDEELAKLLDPVWEKDFIKCLR
ncbi:MAG TPA: radical SAM protein [Candidatus Marinimicrobia bacterium]|nr:radical SAM protein [Candidatus Neomarinimicrobiota bacterium]